MCPRECEAAPLSIIDPQNISAREAKARFGQMLDTAQHEPVTIEKHGRAVAVVVLKEEYDDIEALKLERLRAEVQKGLDAIEGGHFTKYKVGELHAAWT